MNTFLNHHNASGMGQPIAAGESVQVSCKVYDPTILSVNPDGYWYRIASPPWNNVYYSPANTFLDGDAPNSPSYTHNTTSPCATAESDARRAHSTPRRVTARSGAIGRQA